MGLVDILTYHVLPAQVLSTDLKYFQSVSTVEGKNVHVLRTRKGVYVGPSTRELQKVVGADNLASNGVAHIIDGVLPPADNLVESKPNIVELAESVTDLSTLVGAVVAGDLVDTLSSPGPFTVFAPTNEGFGKLPAGTVDTLLKPENKDQLVDILTYHVLGQEVPSKALKYFQRVPTVEGKNLHIYKNFRGVFVSPDGKDFKTVTAADNEASNGVVHIIDGVLLPPSGFRNDKPNIVELAQSVDDLSTLVAAVVAGDLVETLSSPGPFTVFAPTNEAFGALPEGTVDTLLKPENKDQLVDILTYHVLGQEVPSKDLKFFQRVPTVEGKNAHIYKTHRGVFVSPDGKDFKTVTAADNQASNGVVHIIDGVLLPPADVVV